MELVIWFLVVAVLSFIGGTVYGHSKSFLTEFVKIVADIKAFIKVGNDDVALIKKAWNDDIAAIKASVKSIENGLKPKVEDTTTSPVTPTIPGIPQ